MGIAGHDDEITDYSPDGVAARVDAAKSALRELEGVSPADDSTDVTVAAMRERLGIRIELHDAGLDVGELNVIASPLQTMRDVFDLMATGTDEDWALISRRCPGCPTVSPDTPMHCGGGGLWARACGPAGQPRDRAGRPDPAFVRRHGGGCSAAKPEPARRFTAACRGQPPRPTASWPGRWATTSRPTLGSTMLRPRCLPIGCRVGSSALRWISTKPISGACTDWKTLSPNKNPLRTSLYPGASVAEALRRLDDEDRYILHGVDALQSWMQDLSDRAVESLADTHFDIDPPLHRLECRIAPTHTGGIYYTGPSEDLSRPGRMWWSVPHGVDTFHTWQETTTVFHEGVPGHHLQMGRAVTGRSAEPVAPVGLLGFRPRRGLGAVRRAADGETGWLDDGGNRMGMLDAQRFRAARVISTSGCTAG